MMNRRLLGYAILSGAVGLLAQTLLLMAALIMAHGHEGVLGAGLAAWLFWTSLGSAAAGRWPAESEKAAGRLAGLFRILALLLPLTLAYFAQARTIWAVPTGELLSLGQAVAMMALGTAPLAVINGALFASVCALAPEMLHGGETVSRVYGGEALGAGLAGLAFSFFFVGRVGAETLALVLALILLVLARVLDGKTRLGMTIVSVIAATGFWLLASGLAKEALPGSGATWRIRQSTPYQEVAAVDLDGQTTFYQDGLPTLTLPNILADEETAHPPLLAHPAPASVLFIGGTVEGTMREALKHPSVEEAVYVESDPVYLRLILSRKGKRIGSEGRATYAATDARRYLKENRRRFDVIAQTLPTPITAQMNRFYTVEWFDLIRRRLKEDGRFTLALPAAENALNPEMRAFLQLVDRTLRAVFPHVEALPGESILFVAGAALGDTLSESRIVQRAKDRDLAVQYLREDYWASRLDSLRDEQLSLALEDSYKGGTVNRDFNAQGLSKAMALWQSRFPHTPGINWNGLWILAGVLPGLGISILTSRADRKAGILFWSPLSWAVVTLGLTEMALQMFLLFVYQALAGEAYAHLALIMAAYMTGMTLGSALTKRVSRGASTLWALLIGIQAGAILWLALFYLVLIGLASIWRSVLPSAAFTAAFTAMALLAGCLGGLQFPLANQLAVARSSNALEIVGGLYGLDLMGAMAGALLATSVLLPNMGLPGSLAVLAGLNLLSVFMLNRAKTKARS